MNKNKFITCALAAMMLASMAIPASAVNADYGNTTDVVLNYDDSDIPTGPDVDGAYTIKIPSQVELDAEDAGTKGVTLSNKKGTDPKIEFSGLIGQNDYVELNVTSEHDYNLYDTSANANVAAYKVTYTTAENNGVDMQNKVISSNEVTIISNNYAKAFQGTATIDMDFSNNSDTNSIFGKGNYTDTLTFEYRYNGEGNLANLNVNNGETINTSKTITCDNGNIIFDIDKDGIVIAESLAKYALKQGKDGVYEIELDVEGYKTNDEAMSSSFYYSCKVENGAIVNDSVSAQGMGDFNYYASMNECNARLFVEYDTGEEMNAYSDFDTFWGYNSCEF